MKNNEFITIKGARENNLKNVSLSLPRNKLIVFTGLSGSGKSSLAFNTIYEEGRRRYVDSLSSYARMFLGGTKKPNVDSIEGLSPSISIEQKTVHNNPRSTVGTITEIFDYFRLLFARIGIPHCPTHKIKITGQSSKDILNEIYKQPENSKLIIYSPVVDSQKGTHQNLLDSLIKENYLRVRINKQIYNLDEKITLNKNNKHSIDIIVNRVVLNENNYNKIAESIEIATEKSDGIVIVENLDLSKEFMFSKKHSCIHKDFSMPKIETRLFSFNAPYGMCEDCKGLGIQYKADFESIIPEMWKTLEGGAIKYFENTVNSMNMEWQEFKIMLNHYKVPLDVPVDELKKEWIEYIKYGTKVEDEKLSYSITSVNGNTVNRYGYIEGILDKIERMYYETSSDRTREYLNKFMGSFTCGSCKGARLNKNALAVWINGKNINDYIQLSISDCLIEIENLVENHLTNQEKQISNLITKEIINRLTFLKNVGLTYLNLNRAAETLSGGEAQRIRLATQIGSNLTGVLYVLDEPSIGLHQIDNQKLINALKKMVDLGNTLIVVEHDEETMFAADYLVEIGPKAGLEGGEIVASGPLEEFIESKDSITAKYLSGKESIEIPKSRRSGNGKVISILGASENNLKNIDVNIPLGKFIGVTGVSGSGKSTLINEVFVRSWMQSENLMEGTRHKKAKFKGFKNLKLVDKIVSVNQNPIGRTPRSNPATYTSVFDDIRDIFANIEESKVRGYQKGRFSFNVPGGRCEKCSGDGFIKIEMHFLPDVYVSCDDCDGKRYNKETLEIKYHFKNISDVLDMSVDEALKFFENKIKITEKLKIMQEVGLGYIKLGQMSTTLSGGEAQRIKLATYLQKKPTGRTVYVLDEPTTGLHIHDVKKLLKILNRIVDNGDTVLVIEHNLDVIKSCDYIIDLGPDGGVNGGKIVASGTPEQVAKIPHSYTGQFLKKILN
ncbi:excinuclease ABC subunit UvrA [Mycoplasmopsis synoviae]|uniref:excinuclease ABC subunit UvrA n=1 Tax=Mycoplasmopsis synoviae TaxID=2109 RepID=UPI001CE1D6D9|nr:excinuclease ABC subunit UvrA [Mycoplasmopsis synoviae]UBX97658.1 excinuclease ABC subunit UvrA [Mycoplasmopsis synoviae]UBX98343.1 excinuclease ABC subunit UvrA [Mycoplasmopsis synoviae]UBX99557.1 excinuclease ABC subunit UvrA [Mycoplasmopsis synoviae]UBX99900.1 excinuclease ABC subunit UvrA [Mycoplasmopsis synoviae]